jgi:hypothetical protein
MAMKKLQNGKSGGVDGITAEIMKVDMESTTRYLENSSQQYGTKE